MPGDSAYARSIVLKSYRFNRLSIAAILLVVSSLALASLSCQIDIGGPSRPGEFISADPSLATEVTDEWSRSISEAVSSGQVMVIFTEAQITGFVIQRMTDHPTPLLEQPQIYLQEGQIQVYGILERGIFKATTLIRVEPMIDEDGQLSLKIAEASVGPIPAPDLLLESISAVITEALTGSVGTLATGIRITSLAISNGEMSIVGEIR